MLEDFAKRCIEKGFGTELEESDVYQLHDLLTCSDIRYVSHSDAIYLMVFLKNNAIQTEKFTYSMPAPSMEEVEGEQVQALEKAILTQLLRAKGYELDGYEISGVAGIADVAAHKDQSIVIGECGACRITKVLEALSQDSTELWHLPYPEKRFEADDTMTVSGQVHIYRRAAKWHELYLEYNGSKYDKFAAVQKEMT